jgi:O-acetyl-ADP-ribose deacetylase (regulator of RNase III)
MYTVLETYRLTAGISVLLVQGSVVHFRPSIVARAAAKDAAGARSARDHMPAAAIVNAANPGCIGGGGVDGAISAAGGVQLHQDRRDLPVVRRSEDGYPIRCPVGRAVVTGPGDYGSLRVSHVIHAVGPNYNAFEEEDYDKVHPLLQSAYAQALSAAVSHGLAQVAFSLLSAGIFRGECSLEQVLRLGMESIRNWGEGMSQSAADASSSSSLQEIYVFAFTEDECDTLREICQDIFEVVEAVAPAASGRKKEISPAKDEPASPVVQAEKGQAAPSEEKDEEMDVVQEEKKDHHPVVDKEKEPPHVVPEEKEQETPPEEPKEE